jgi:hypothetical protein
MSLKALGSALALAALAACGGGGGSNGPTSPPPPMAGIVFSGASGGTSNVISLVAESATSPTTLALDLRASGVANLYGVAFSLTYPTNVLQFNSATEGTFLNAAGTSATTFQETETPTGTVVVGISRLGAVQGASGSGILATFHFTAAGSGTGAFAFSRNAGLDSTGAPLNLTWTAGTVQVTTSH